MAGARRGGFRKSQRLRVRREFDRVQNGSSTSKAGSRHFLVLVARREDEPATDQGPVADGAGARLGVIASRRVGSAVLRNRAKRRVREFFRANAGDLGNVDVVVVVKSGAHALPMRDAEGELASGLRRALRGLKPAAPAVGEDR